jgi:hypothetical protein
MNASPNDITEKLDAYLIWGLSTGFNYFHTGTRRDANHFIGLLIEWNSLEDARHASSLAAAAGAVVAGAYDGGSGKDSKNVRRIWAVAVPTSCLERFFSAVGSFARRMELASPIRSPTPGVLRDRLILQSDEEILAAVLDDGCAFANARFMRAGKTRVLWLWNQDEDAVGAPLDGSNGPSKTADFGYGAQWSGPALDDFILVAKGSQDQIYDKAGLPGLRRAAAHGTHVMDLLCGRENWQIAFVQFPLAGISDPSGKWLARYALDGLHYVLECAGSNTKKVVVNISWGPQTGPHDGSSILEAAIDELVTTQPTGRQLIVSVPAGNSFSSQAHARIDYSTGGSVNWIVPPDGATAAFLEIWWPKSIAPSEARLRVVPPSGPGVDVTPGTNVSSPNWFATLIQPVGQGAMALVVVHPTDGFNSGVRGPHGRWRIDLDPGPSGKDGEVHLYVARADHNMGARRRAKASYLSDGALASARFVSPEKRYAEAIGSVIRRAGTLNGLSTGASTKVAAGFTFIGFASPPYSSSGGSRGARAQPDYSCVTEQSLAVAGVRASGVRSGTMVRLVGTSSAAPQLGRQLANKSMVEFIPYPNYVPARVGAACLWPDDGVIHRA